jgi:hypothetical protein
VPASKAWSKRTLKPLAVGVNAFDIEQVPADGDAERRGVVAAVFVAGRGFDGEAATGARVQVAGLGALYPAELSLWPSPQFTNQALIVSWPGSLAARSDRVGQPPGRVAAPLTLSVGRDVGHADG